MDSQIEAMSAAVKALSIADDTVGEWPMEVIEKCIDASVWAPFKGVILGNSKTILIAGISTVEIAKWAISKGLLSRRVSLDDYVARIMVQKGYIEVLEYLCSKGLDLFWVVSAAFNEQGSMETVRWLHGNGLFMSSGFFKSNEDVCWTAVYYNRVDILEWAVKQGFKYTFDMPAYLRLSRDPKMREFANRIHRV